MYKDDLLIPVDIRALTIDNAIRMGLSSTRGGFGRCW